MRIADREVGRWIDKQIKRQTNDERERDRKRERGRIEIDR
jgi:hypothetical protein